MGKLSRHALAIACACSCFVLAGCGPVVVVALAGATGAIATSGGGGGGGGGGTDAPLPPVVVTPPAPPPPIPPAPPAPPPSPPPPPPAPPAGPLTVASISPSGGPIAGGTSVSITGTNFLPGTTATIAGSPLANVSVVSSSTITGVTSTTIAVGLGDVVVSGSNGTGTLQTAFDYRLGLTYTGSPVATSGTPFDMLTADFNNDGKLDLAYATRGAFIGVRLGDGTGAFPGLVSTAVPGHNVYGIDAGFLNGDANLDVVAADIDGSRILVFHGNGTGALNYVSPTITGVGPYPERLRLGHFDGDGHLDVAIPLFYTGLGMSPGFARVLIGNGLGHFQSPGVNYDTLNGPQNVAIVDMDLDGNLDFFTTNVQSPSLSFLRGNGDGTFQAQVPVAVATQNAGLAVADFKKTGRPQVFVTFGSSPPELVSRDQAGNFTSELVATTRTGHLTNVVADINRDGYPDVVAIAISGTEHSVWLNNRNGGFVEYLISGVASDGKVVAGDFDGDGRVDVALPSPGEASVRIYLNK